MVLPGMTRQLVIQPNRKAMECQSAVDISQVKTGGQRPVPGRALNRDGFGMGWALGRYSALLAGARGGRPPAVHHLCCVVGVWRQRKPSDMATCG